MIAWSFAGVRSRRNFRLIRGRTRRQVRQMILGGRPWHPPAFGREGLPGAQVGLFLRQHLQARRLPGLWRHDRRCVHSEMSSARPSPFCHSLSSFIAARPAMMARVRDTVHCLSKSLNAVARWAIAEAFPAAKSFLKAQKPTVRRGDFERSNRDAWRQSTRPSSKASIPRTRVAQRKSLVQSHTDIPVLRHYAVD